MIFHFNSNYRNRTLYPFSTSFVIPINGTPPPNSFELDSRSILLANQEILFSFIYFQTMPVSFFLYNSNQVLLQMEIPNYPSLAFYFQNTLAGIVLQELDSQFSSIIKSSLLKENGILCELENPLSLEIGLDYQGQLENPSNQFSHSFRQNNLLINGFSKYNFAPGMRQLQDDGITKDCIVINLTKQTYFLIQDIIPPYRNVLITPFSNMQDPSFEDGDYLMAVTPSVNSNIPLVRILSYAPYGCRSLQLLHSTHYPIFKSTIFSDPLTQLRIEIMETMDHSNAFLQIPPTYRILHPGNFKHWDGLSISLVSEQDPSHHLRVKLSDLGFSFVVDQIPPLVNLTRSKFMFVWLSIQQAIPIYSYVLYIDERMNRIYTEIPDLFFTSSISYMDHLYSIGGFIFLQTFFPNLIYPISNNTLQCYTVELISLTLPNRPLCGTNQLLADIPFVLVQFGNMNSNLDQFNRRIQNINSTTIYSNIPSAQNATFVCSIANIRNPDIYQYVVVSSDQVVTLKLNLQEDLILSVFLPNGDLLIFSPLFLIQEPKKIQSAPVCPTHYAYNPTQQNLIYANEEDLFISATFVLQISS